ncbi:MAG: hypothetical protein QM581_14555 [Pseudomonas sp.]
MTTIQLVLQGGAVSLLLAMMPAWGASRAPRPLAIRSAGAQVLACVPSDEDDIVEVADAGISPIGAMDDRLPPRPWQITLGTNVVPLRLMPGQCLEFRQLPPGYIDVVPPSDLRDGWPYTFAIRSAGRGRHGTRNHAGDFCISRSGKTVEVVQVPRTAAAVTSVTCGDLFKASAPL